MELYTRENIKGLLENYLDLSLETRLDIDRVINSNLINGKQLQIMFCLFNLNLNVMETVELLGLTPLQFREEYEEMFEAFEAVLNGYRTKSEKKGSKETCAQNVQQLLYYLALGDANPFGVLNERVRHSLLVLSINKYKDVLSKEVLHQKVHGKPLFEEESEYTFGPVVDGYELGLFNIYKTERTGDDVFAKQYVKNKVTLGSSFNLIGNKDLTGRKKTLFKSDNGTSEGETPLY